MAFSERRKALFVFVEGKADRIALRRYFESVLGETGRYLVKIYLKPGEIDERTKQRSKAGGDITSDNTIPYGSVCDAIYENVLHYCKLDSIPEEDVIGIIQLVDTDGAFVSDSQIVEDSRLEKPFYDTSNKQIRTHNRNSLLKRNRRKSFNMSLLSAQSDINGIPYRVFYMSCNLDHVLFNKPNNSEKIVQAKTFAGRFADDEQNLARFLASFLPKKAGNYEKSWKYIRDRKQPNRSLERGSNLATLKQATSDSWGIPSNLP